MDRPTAVTGGGGQAAAGERAVAFDPLATGFDAWPYDQYRALRERDPIHRSELLCGWVLTRFDDCSAILRDPRASSDLDNATPSVVVDLLRSRNDARERDGRPLVIVDDPDHARLRRYLQPHFTARRIEQLRATVERRVGDAVARLEGRDEIELVSDFAYPLPVEVFCEMLGFPDEAGPRFRDWTAAVARTLDLVISEDEYVRCQALTFEMEEYLASMVERKRREPADDILSNLVATADEHGVGDGELVAQLVTLYVAGHEPTTALIGNGVAALLAHPGELAQLQEDPSLVAGAMAELLRYDGPNQFVRRIAVEPIELDGRRIEAGDVLYVCVGAANHDPAHWGDDADALRVRRPDAAQHLQFGTGAHHCLGSHLARLQAEVALTALLRRFRIEAAGPVTWAGRSTLRSVAEVPLRLS